MNTIISVENLKCNGCASTIRKGLEQFDEIQNINIDIEKSTVEIEFNGDNKNIEIYKSKLRKLGYPEGGNNSTISAAKSYISCAVGKFSNN